LLTSTGFIRAFVASIFLAANDRRIVRFGASNLSKTHARHGYLDPHQCLGFLRLLHSYHNVEAAMIVSDVMTREVASVKPESALKDAVFLMVDRKLSGLPVVDDDGHVVGMITEGDLMRRSEIGTQGREPGWFELLFMPGTAAYDYVRTHARKVEMLMSSNVVSIAPSAELAEAARLMQKHGVKRLPVVEDGRLVGILARADLLKMLAGALESCLPVSDSELMSRISAELKGQGWIPKANVHVSVDDGVVELSGVVMDMRHRDALSALAESAGARQVRNKMVCIEPLSATRID